MVKLNSVVPGSADELPVDVLLADAEFPTGEELLEPLVLQQIPEGRVAERVENAHKNS